MASLKQKKITLLLFLLLHLVLLVNTRFTVWPEMVLYPYLLNNGFLLYKDIINPYFPTLPLVLSGVFQLLGDSVLSLKIFTWFVILLSDIVLYYSAFRLTGSKFKSVLTVLFFALLQMSLGGNGLWFELFLVPFVAPAVTLVLKDNNSPNRLMLAGLLLALAISIKQNAIYFYVPVIFYLFSKEKFSKLVYLLAPGILVMGFFLIYLFSQNIFNDFYLWAVVLPLSYTSQPGFVSLPAIRQYIFILFPLVTLFFGVFLHKKYLNKEKIYWLLTFLSATIFAFPRYEDFHLQLVVAISSLFVSFLPRNVLVVFTLVTLILFGRGVTKNWHTEDRFMDRETIGLSSKIKDFNNVYSLNGPDLAYFLSGKLPSKPWAINFPWYFEQEGFEERFVKGLSDREFIIAGDRLGGGKYDLGNYIPEKIEQYILANYKMKERYKNYQIWQKN